MTSSGHVDALLAKVGGWRGRTLAAARDAILAADQDIVEAVKYMGSPVWSCAGTIAVGNAHRDKVKLTFAHGAVLPDPDGLFNAGLGGKQWRAIDLHEGDKLDAAALTRLVRAAIAFNRGRAGNTPSRPRRQAAPKQAPSRRRPVRGS